MPFSSASRAFLTAALVNLGAAGATLLLCPNPGALALRWDLVVWLLLVGFVGSATTGFALHLFPTFVRRPMRAAWAGPSAFVLAEAGVVFGGAGLAGVAAPFLPERGFALGALSYLAAVGVVFGLLVHTSRQPRFVTPGPLSRPGDALSLPLVLASWAAALGSAVLFVLSGLENGPGFGWWIAAVHLFVLGHVVLLVTAVSLRLLPRSLEANVPRPVGVTLAVLALSGAVLVPTGMLGVAPSSANDVAYFATPEAAFALLFLATLAFLGGRARAPRRQLVLQITGVVGLVVGGALGLWMVTASTYALVVPHALLLVLGFLGLTILVTWFGMVAPFQRLSHVWTRRMLWALASVWMLGVVVAVLVTSPGATGAGGLVPLVGGLVLGAAVVWGAGSIPVLYPRSIPSPERARGEPGWLRRRRRVR